MSSIQDVFSQMLTRVDKGEPKTRITIADSAKKEDAGLYDLKVAPEDKEGIRGNTLFTSNIYAVMSYDEYTNENTISIFTSEEQAQKLADKVEGANIFELDQVSFCNHMDKYGIDGTDNTSLDEVSVTLQQVGIDENGEKTYRMVLDCDDEDTYHESYDKKHEDEALTAFTDGDINTEEAKDFKPVEPTEDHVYNSIEDANNDVAGLEDGEVFSYVNDYGNATKAVFPTRCDNTVDDILEKYYPDAKDLTDEQKQEFIQQFMDANPDLYGTVSPEDGTWSENPDMCPKKVFEARLASVPDLSEADVINLPEIALEDVDKCACKPGKPHDPTPSEPVDPVTPEDPTPVDPEDPTPVDPEDPTPVDPEDPSPVDPEDPTPVDPETPGEVDPEDPSPVDPETPGEVDPEDPGEVDPENPGEVDPENPGEVNPEDPTTPGTEDPGETNPEDPTIPGTEDPGETNPENPTTPGTEEPGETNPETPVTPGTDEPGETNPETPATPGTPDTEEPSNPIGGDTETPSIPDAPDVPDAETPVSPEAPAAQPTQNSTPGAVTSDEPKVESTPSNDSGSSDNSGSGDGDKSESQPAVVSAPKDEEPKEDTTKKAEEAFDVFVD